jgi:hypothetical protein
MFERILFVWSVRHPASGYVQGMNDVLTPFFFVFLTQMVPDDVLNETGSIADLKTLDCVSDDNWKIIEADCFWCFSKLLDGIQDFYTKDQPGLYRMLDQFKQIVLKVDPEMGDWIEREEISYAEFAFRWINCLLVRELSLPLIFRLWDMYLCEYSKIANRHVYVCAALLNFLSSQYALVGKNHSDFIVLVQSIDPNAMSIEDLEMVLAQGYIYEQMCRQPRPLSATRSASTPSFRQLE